jgi:hypothetical protein
MSPASGFFAFSNYFAYLNLLNLVSVLFSASFYFIFFELVRMLASS